ncbi:MAG: glycosyltransferase family 2 protein [Cyanobacteriota bacterium]
MGLSIVTVCMNRREHLLATAPKVAAWPHHGEHLIVDWSSAVPLRREELPADPRIRLLRVEGEPRWNLCRAYNFAVAQARGEWLLKLDADAWPTEAFAPDQPGLRLEGDGSGERGPLCAFGSGPEGRKGQFLIERGLFEAVGGFNELLVGYGFDDKDLLARLLQHSGEMAAKLPQEWIGVIAHSDAERAEQGASRGGLAVSQGLAAMRATRLANRLLAAHHPWGRLTPRSRYEEEVPDHWRVLPGTVPRPTAETADEIEHARRMAFWSCFLAIPDVFLADLPIKLVPHPRRGVWQVRWWHRLWWHTGRRLLQLPVIVLSWTRGILTNPPKPF